MSRGVTDEATDVYNNDGFDHDEVRCETMADCDCDTKLIGEPRTCCVCIEHGCAEHLAEREKHPKPPEAKDDLLG